MATPPLALGGSPDTHTPPPGGHVLLSPCQRVPGLTPPPFLPLLLATASPSHSRGGHGPNGPPRGTAGTPRAGRWGGRPRDGLRDPPTPHGGEKPLGNPPLEPEPGRGGCHRGRGLGTRLESGLNPDRIQIKSALNHRILIEAASNPDRIRVESTLNHRITSDLDRIRTESWNLL